MEVFVANSLALLALERETEVRRSEGLLSSGQLLNVKELEAKGVCLQRLEAASQNVGLYGRQVVTFELSSKVRRGSKKAQLPSNTITPGDIVGVYAACKPLADRTPSGVVTRSSDSGIVVAFDDLPESLDLSSCDGSLQLVKLANDVTYRRITRSLDELRSLRPGAVRHLVEILFGDAPLAKADTRLSHWVKEEEKGSHQSTGAMLQQEASGFQFFNPMLDPSQQRAVVFALSRPDIAVIHGPPGTGKTTTVVEVILQSVHRGQKVLACAPSNIAVDNMVDHLGRSSTKVVRIGHPARLVESVQRYSLDALLSARDSASIIHDVTTEIEGALSRLAKASGPAEKRRWRREVKTLRKELKQRQEKATREFLSSANVVLSTNTGASVDGPLSCLPEDHFDVVVIDECAQSLEASCWIPLLRAPKCVLAGDHMQLPPTIISQEAADKGLSVTLMERLVELYSTDITSMLTVQYRMHEKIMTWPSVSLYKGQLVAHHLVAHHLLCDLPGVSETRSTCLPLLFIDTAGCGLEELLTSDEESKGNEGEADLVVHHLKALLAAGLPAKKVAVIAPYNLQVDLIRQRLPSLGPSHSQLEVRSVDGFQGREKEAVIISLTRSNSKGEFGFLSERRRTNVAVTRARRHLALIGDSETVSHEPFLRGMIEYCHREGEVWSAHEFLQASDFEESHYYRPKHKAVVTSSADKGSPSDSTEGGKGRKSRKKRKPGDFLKLEQRAVTDPDQAESTPANLSDVSEEVRESYRQQLLAFLEQKVDEGDMVYPVTLTGAERRVIHELCEEFGLEHVSRGQGKERHIEVRKSRPPQTGVQCTDSKVAESPGGNKSATSPEEPQRHKVYKICPICGKPILQANLELHQVHCEKLHAITVTGGAQSKQTAPPTGPPGVSGSRKKKAKGTLADAADSTADLDALLAEVSLSDSRCAHHGCSKPVSVLGMVCQFCRRRFCMAHSMAEVHGCAEAARQLARKQLREELKGGHSRGAKTVDVTRRAQLEQKLNKKISSLSKERKSASKK